MMTNGRTGARRVVVGGLPARKVTAPSLDIGDEPVSSPHPAASAPTDVRERVDADRSRADDAGADRIVIRLDEAQGRALHGFVIRMGLSADEADDAVQEVLLRLWSSLRSGSAIDDPKAWAFRSIYRLAMDAHRWRRRVDALRSRLSLGAVAETANEADRASDLSIWTAVDRLPPRQREILYLRYKADMSFEQAAAVMGITGGAARANATKAMASLRRTVGGRETW